jgi:hypothetical protein
MNRTSIELGKRERERERERRRGREREREGGREGGRERERERALIENYAKHRQKWFVLS